MSDPTILFCKPGSVSSADKKTLKEVGIIVVTVDDPNSVRLTKACVDLSGNELLSIAMGIVANHSCSEPKRLLMDAVAKAFHS